MLLKGFITRADYETKEQLWAFVDRNKGFISILADDRIRYFIREDLAEFLYLIDPTIQRDPKWDYIA